MAHLRTPILLVLLLLTACTLDLSPTDVSGGLVGGIETAMVTDIIDGDTIEVQIEGVDYRVRYIGINTPERDEECYSEAWNANADLVEGQLVTLVRDSSQTDQYGRLLRYVYVDDMFVNARLVEQGWAENAEYPPDTAHADEFRALEAAAARRNLGCHPTGIFDDGDAER